jgi:hypothetical protein
LLSLAACDGDANASSAVNARRAQDTPQLWLVQVIGEGGLPTAPTFVCASTPPREAFVHTLQVEGAPCRDVTPPLMRKRHWALRCRAKGSLFAVSDQTLGDVTEDFRLVSMLTPVTQLSGVGPLRLAQRFRHVGSCPPGWRVGDQASPGQRPRRHRS